MKNTIVLILWNCATLEEARRICHELLEKRLIACANILPHVESLYLWENKIESGNETKVFLKTLQTHFEGVKKCIKEHCSYDIPEISKVHIDAGNPDYLEWIENAVEKGILL